MGAAEAAADDGVPEICLAAVAPLPDLIALISSSSVITGPGGGGGASAVSRAGPFGAERAVAGLAGALPWGPSLLLEEGMYRAASAPLAEGPPADCSSSMTSVKLSTCGVRIDAGVVGPCSCTGSSARALA